ncbi:hypothetical protein VB779_00145 [Haloarculaceae archaeon H-GB11]|nr:hypothetical protein [Haloarculaceae archaeon H-GB11]
MQRRAAAIYLVFFVLVGAGAYGVLVTAPQPHVTFDKEAYAANDSFTVEGQTYTVSEVSTETSGGGHGSAATTTTVGTVAWVNDSAKFTATLENGSTVTRDNTTYQVLTRPNQSEFVLRETRNLTQILQTDTRVQNETVTLNGTEYVYFTDDETLLAVSAYLGEPETQTYAAGDTYQYEGNETTISAITVSEVTLTWTGTKTNTADLSQGGNVTLGDQTYLVNFPDTESVQILSTNEYYDDYQQQLATIDSYHERTNGLWGIVILSGVAATLLLMTAYLPTRG